MNIKERYLYIVIFLAAFLIRLMFVYSYNVPLGGDELGYNQLAVSIFSEHKYFVNATYSKPPGYPFFISLVYWLFGYSHYIVRIFQALLDSVLCVLMYWLCGKLFNKKVALIATVFSVSYLLFIKATPRFLTESIFTSMLFLTSLYIFKGKESFTYPNAVITGLLIVAMTLTKGVMLLFLPFLLFILLSVRHYKDKRIIKKIMVMVLAFIIPLSAWTCRNYKVYGKFLPVSTQGGYAFYGSYFPRDEKVYGVNPMDDNVRYAFSLNSQTEMSSYLAQRTIEFIKNNPLKVMRLEALKFLYFWCPFDWEIMGVGRGVYNFQYVFMLPFSIFGIALLLKKFDQYAVLFVPIVYIFMMSMLFYGSPRFRMPEEPYLIILFSFGIFRFFQIFKNKYIPMALSILYASMNLAMYLNTDLIKGFFRNSANSIGLW